MDKGFCEIDIDRLVMAGWNYKENNQELATKLENNIKRNGQIENIIIRELDTGFFEVVNGNHRLDVLKSLGFDKVYCYNLGQISEATAKRIAIETNETKFSTNQDLLSGLLAEIVEVDGFEDVLETMPFNEDELNSMLADIDETDNSGIDTIGEPDDEEIVVEKPHTVAGDIYELNGHRLICGDSTSKSVIDRLFAGEVANLVVTDPPYGVDYGKKNENLNSFNENTSGKRGGRIETDIVNDAISDYRKFFRDFISVIPFADINSFYSFISHSNLHNLILALEDTKLYFSSILVWLKNQQVVSWKDYMPKTEFLVYGWKDKHEFYGASNSVNVLEFNKPSSSKLHPTMKPVEMIERLILNNSKNEEIVYDAFAGSGTTLIASENQNRKCYTVELSEHYCDVVVKRWVRQMKELDRDFCVKLNGEDITDEEWLDAEH